MNRLTRLFLAFVLLSTALTVMVPASTLAQTAPEGFQHGTETFSRNVVDGFGTSEFAGNPEWEDDQSGTTSVNGSSGVFTTYNDSESIYLNPVEDSVDVLFDFRWTGGESASNRDHTLYVWGYSRNEGDSGSSSRLFKVGLENFLDDGESESSLYLDTIHDATYIDIPQMEIGTLYSMRISADDLGVSATLWEAAEEEPAPLLTVADQNIPFSSTKTFWMDIAGGPWPTTPGWAVELESITVTDSTVDSIPPGGFDHGKDDFTRTVPAGWGQSEFAGGEPWVNRGDNTNVSTTGTTAIMGPNGYQRISLDPAELPMEMIFDFRWMGGDPEGDYDHGFWFYGYSGGDYLFDAGITQYSYGGSVEQEIYIWTNEDGGYANQPTMTFGEWYSLRLAITEDGTAMTLWPSAEAEPAPQVTTTDAAMPFSAQRDFVLEIESATFTEGAYTEFNSITVRDVNDEPDGEDPEEPSVGGNNPSSSRSLIPSTTYRPDDEESFWEISDVTSKSSLYFDEQVFSLTSAGGAVNVSESAHIPFDPARFEPDPDDWFGGYYHTIRGRLLLAEGHGTTLELCFNVGGCVEEISLGDINGSVIYNNLEYQWEPELTVPDVPGGPMTGDGDGFDTIINHDRLFVLSPWNVPDGATAVYLRWSVASEAELTPLTFGGFVVATSITRVEVEPTIAVTAPALLNFGSGVPDDVLTLPATVVNVATNNATGYTLEADWSDLDGVVSTDAILASALTFALDGTASTSASERTEEAGTNHALTGSITLPFVTSDTYDGTATFTATTQ